MGTGRLIRQTRTHDASYQLCQCGHEMRLHLELDPTDPTYRPLHFVCRECGCADSQVERRVPKWVERMQHGELPAKDLTGRVA